MFTLLKVVKKLKSSIIKISWPFIFAAMMIHLGLSWSLMVLAGETPLVGENWLYYYITTVSTVGYGDYSPQTFMGKMVVALFIMPGGVGIFASVIGKISVLVGNIMTNKLKGLNDYSNLSGHTVVVGWHGDATKRIISILDEDETSGETLLCVIRDMENPFPDSLLFVRGESFASESLLRRAGVHNASRVIIYDECDEKTATIAMSVYAVKSPECHVVAYCNDVYTASMINRSMPEIECTKSMSLEMLVRSATDAGISRVVEELLSVTTGSTQFQLKLPNTLEGITFGELFSYLKETFNVTLLGAQVAGQRDILNLPNHIVLPTGTMIYYMGQQRLIGELLCTPTMKS